jgi:hypothetical protein
MIIINIKGGIGNQIFQYAFGRTLEMHGKTVKYDVTSFEGYRHEFRLNYFNTKLNIATKNDIEIYKCHFNFNNSGKIFLNAKNSLFGKVIRKLFKMYDACFYTCRPVVLEKYFFDKRLFYCDNKYFDGYWGNKKYFGQTINILQREISLQHKYYNDDYIKLAEEIENSKIPFVSLHVRRGDYLWDVNQNIFVNLSTDYYTKALAYVKEKIGDINVLVFSNDIIWCKSNFGDGFLYVDEQYNLQDYHEFGLMKLCHHNIIANSTFSFWAAYLNKSPAKIIIAPQKWYVHKKFQKMYEKDIFVPKGWIKV